MATPARSRPEVPPSANLPWRRAALFALLVALVVGALGTLYEVNRERIERNAEAWLARRIAAVLPQGSFDNDPLHDRIAVTSPDLLGTSQPVPVYRARLHGQPAAVVMLPYAPDGYGGPIRLLVAIDFRGTVLVVQVLEHNETAGLGDAFAVAGATWLDSFAGRSLPLSATGPAAWKVRKDGGEFDQFTGATVTPRAIVKAVQRALEYYRANRNTLFSPSQEQQG